MSDENHEKTYETHEAIVDAAQPDLHLEQWALLAFGAAVGSRRQAHIAAKAGRILVNGVAAMPSHHVQAGDVVVFRLFF